MIDLEVEKINTSFCRPARNVSVRSSAASRYQMNRHRQRKHRQRRRGSEMPSVEVTCAYCGGKCEKSPHQVESNKRGVFFCSMNHQKAWLKEHHGWNKGEHITFGYRRKVES